MFVRLGWKCLPGTNTSFLQKIVIYGEKFITLTPEANVIIFFTVVSYEQ